jgi:hypothetical protein
MAKKAKKKYPRKASKKASKKRSTLPTVATLAKKTLPQLTTLGTRVSKAVDRRIASDKKKSRAKHRKGFLAGLISGPLLPSKQDREYQKAQEVIRELQP